MRSSIEFEKLPIELQWKIEQQRRRNEAIADWLTAAFVTGCTLVVTVPALNQWGDRLLSLPVATNANVASTKTGARTETINSKFLRPIALGEKIGDLQVGQRGYFPCQKWDKSDCTVHPITGLLGSHKGIDLGARQGRPQRVAGSKGPVNVKCHNQPGGAGLWATITPAEPKGVEFRSFHLSTCNPGTYELGKSFGTTGSTGLSTAPHWHWEQFEGDRWVHPQFAWLYQSVTGRLPNE